MEMFTENATEEFFLFKQEAVSWFKGKEKIEAGELKQKIKTYYETRFPKQGILCPDEERELLSILTEDNLLESSYGEPPNEGFTEFFFLAESH